MPRADSFRGKRIYTVGHSTRTFDELLAMLQAFQVSTLVDIRTVPRSRHNPQFNHDALGAALAARGLGYVHLAELGGLRKTRPDSPNQGWRNLSFRGYADHMASPEFEAGLRKLHALGDRATLALMCAEAVPWRCHRSLVADALLVRGAEVHEIASAARATPHRITKFAAVEGTRITYEVDASLGAQLATGGPLHLEATVRVLQRRPTSPGNLWEQERYLRLQPRGESPTLLEVRNHGTIAAPDLRVLVRAGDPSADCRAELILTLRRLLGLDVDPRRLASVGRRVPALREITEALRGMRPPRFASLFEAFVNVIPFQQVSLDAGVSVVNRLSERFGARLDHEGHSHRASPTAEVIAGARLDALRRCGLSARKAEALRAIARAVASGALTERALEALDTAEALRALTALPGIGPWSANLVLLRGLGRLDAFPPGDVGATRGLQAVLKLDAPSELDAIVERLGPDRGYLYFCALGSSLLAKGLIHPAGARKRS